MDTKSKRWKKVVSLGALFLGTGLLVLDTVLAMLFLYSGGTEAAVKDAFRESYQDTAAFQDYLSEYLNGLLNEASGFEIDYWKSYPENYSEYVNSTLVSPEEDTLVSVSEDVEGAAEVFDEAGDGSVQKGTSYTMIITEASDGSQAEEGTAVAAAESAEVITEAAVPFSQVTGDFHVFQDEEGNIYKIYTDRGDLSWDLSEDKNVLFAIFEGDAYQEPLYTNAAGSGLENGLPEGYNFLLTLEDNRVTIQKDGQELDVYGNGYYSQSSEWRVPGYENMSQDSCPPDLNIVLAVKEVPARYYSAARESYYTSDDDFNGCYTIVRSMQEARSLYLFWLVSLITGTVLVLLRFVFWRAGSEGKRQLAGSLSHLWWGLKTVGFGLLFLTAAYFFVSLMDGSSGYAWEMVHLSDRSGNLYFWLLLALAYLFIEVMGIVFYLCCADLEYGKPWRNTLIGSLIRGIRRLWRMRQQRLPFAKRIMRQYLGALWPVFLLGLAGAGVFALIGVAVGGSAQWLVAFTFFVLAAGALGVLYTQYRYAAHLDALMTDVQDLTEQIRAIREGHMEAELEVPETSELKETFENLNAIQEGMQAALAEQVKSERMKIELIANVSHDIKTPLTSIISYVEILKQEEDLPEDIKDYISILESKSQRLKTMVQDVFEVSKAASGELPVKPEVLDYGKLLRQTLADMAEDIEKSPVRIRTEIPEKPVPILADGQRLYRVFQNLLVNALKYSLEGSRIYVSLKEEEKQAVVTVKNTSRTELAADVDFTERFVRGDSSRTDGGSGLGLSIARSFTEACGGMFQIRTDADLFTAMVTFSLTEQKVLPETDREEPSERGEDAEDGGTGNGK